MKEYFTEQTRKEISQANHMDLCGRRTQTVGGTRESETDLCTIACTNAVEKWDENHGQNWRLLPDDYLQRANHPVSNHSLTDAAYHQNCG